MIYLKHQVKDNGRRHGTDKSTEYSAKYRGDLGLRTVHCHSVFIVKIGILIASEFHILGLGIKLLVYAAVESVCLKRIHDVFDISGIYPQDAEYYSAYEYESEDVIESEILIKAVYDHTHEDAVKENPLSVTDEPEEK